MTAEILKQLYKIAEMNGLNFTAPNKNNSEIYFWTNQDKPFKGRLFNLDAEQFFELCKQERFFVELDLKSKQQ